MTSDSQYRGTPLTSLNAIKLSATEVAETFIAPPAFRMLARADNAILSGPRGSGKTTLLKMLQSEGLEAWKAASADEAREEVRNVGVFVGTDRSWNEQLTLPTAGVPEVIRSRIAWSAFGTHTYRSLVDAMQHRTLLDTSHVAGHLRVEMTESQERALVAELAMLMRFESKPFSFSVLSRMLHERLIELGTFRQRAKSTGDVTLPDWVDLDVLTLVDASANAFNVAASQPDQRWALLFDELELAPEPLVHELLAALRGHQPRLVFKLSLAPANNILTALEGTGAPIQGQDYEHIPLTHARKTATLQFSKELVHETLRLQGLDPKLPVALLLGEGYLDSSDEFDEDLPQSSARASRNPYAVGSPLWLRMEALAEKDATFTNYLVKNHMDLQRLESLSPTRRASRLRKIRNIVVVREYFRNDYGRRRSRKSFALYSGADNILSLPDGNPRVLIALARQLSSSVHGGGMAARVPGPAQGVAIEATLLRFLPLLESQDAVRVGKRLVSLMEFLDIVGASLARRVVEGEFNDNVRLTFQYDSNRLTTETESLVRQGVNTGALVFVPRKDSDSRLHGSFDGKQFRLSHLLATKYGLPIHLTPSVGLSALLPPLFHASPRRRARSQPTSQPQLPMGDDVP